MNDEERLKIVIGQMLSTTEYLFESNKNGLFAKASQLVDTGSYLVEAKILIPM